MHPNDQLLNALTADIRALSTKFLVEYKADGKLHEHPVASEVEGRDWITRNALHIQNARVLHADGPLAGRIAVRGLTC